MPVVPYYLLKFHFVWFVTYTTYHNVFSSTIFLPLLFPLSIQFQGLQWNPVPTLNFRFLFLVLSNVGGYNVVFDRWVKCLLIFVSKNLETQIEMLYSGNDNFFLFSLTFFHQVGQYRQSRYSHWRNLFTNIRI